MSRISGASIWAPVAAVGVLAALVGASGCDTPAPPQDVLAASVRPQQLKAPISLARLDGPFAQCPSPAAPASDQGMCNVVGSVLTLTFARSVRLVAESFGGYEVDVRLSAAEEQALTALIGPTGYDIGIAVADSPVISMVFVGDPGDTLRLPFNAQSAAKQLFDTLTGQA